MQYIISDLNCNEKEYKFNLSNITEQEWTKFARDVLVACLPVLRGTKITGYRVKIRDNKAKVLICWKDEAYHEKEFHLDEFGRVSKNYQDIVSNIWQNVMSARFGEEYDNELNAKLSELKSETV